MVGLHFMYRNTNSSNSNILAGKNVASSMKESAVNIAASALSGMEKTKAIVQETAERMTTLDPIEKDMAKERKEERINQAEFNKQEARAFNAQERQAATTGGPHPYSTTAHPPGAHQISAFPGHGTAQPTGQVTEPEGMGGSHPAGIDRRTGTRRTTADNTRVGGDTNTGYGTGGDYR